MLVGLLEACMQCRGKFRYLYNLTSIEGLQTVSTVSLIHNTACVVHDIRSPCRKNLRRACRTLEHIPLLSSMFSTGGAAWPDAVNRPAKCET